ncbi:MAG: nodulation protein NfeD [Armatimonadetes bacterium]|nr:nodulation protein NfeD [Armatimonadota bacterium]
MECALPRLKQRMAARGIRRRDRARAARRGLWSLTALALLFAAGLAPAPAQSRPPIYVLQVEGVIDPSVAGYLDRGITEAEDAGAAAVVIEMDTPGGLLDSTRDIVRRMLGARVPLVVYVAPSGARAGSAGTFITAAAHVAAMAPGTNIGAAHPIDGATGKTVAEKVTNDAAAFIRTVAEKRNRNAEWYVSAVRQSQSITEKQAREKNVVELIADSRMDLLRQLDGRKVEGHALRTAGAPVQEVPMDIRERFLHRLSHPNIAYILMIIAVYGIIAELQNPGLIFPGVAGVTALLLALYSLAVLPINTVGLLLILLGVGLMIADIKVPSHGILTAAGAVAFAFGSFMLVRSPDPFLRISAHLIVSATVVTTLFFAFVVGAGLRAQRLRITTGLEGLLGQSVVVKRDVAPVGKVLAEGEIWNAESEDGPIAAGERAVVVGVDKFTLRVRKET